MTNTGQIRPTSKTSNITQKWVNLLIPFSEDYSARKTASELARKSGKK